MRRRLAFALCLAAAQVVSAHGHPAQVGDDMPDAQTIRFCSRVRDFATRAFNDREKGKPMKLFEEDGSDGPRVTNHIIRRIYEEPQISSPKKADAFARATCNELFPTGSPE
jgi:hypothetical protein